MMNEDVLSTGETENAEVSSEPKKKKVEMPKIFKNKVFIFIFITVLVALSGFLLFLIDDNNSFRSMMGITPESVAWLRNLFHLDVTIVTWLIFAIISGTVFFVFFVILFKNKIKNSIERRRISKGGAAFTEKGNVTYQIVFWSLLALAVIIVGFSLAMMIVSIGGGSSLGKQLASLGDPGKLGLALLQFLASVGILLLVILVIPAVIGVFYLVYKGIVLLVGGVAGGVAKNVMASSNFQETYAAAQAASNKINEMANQLPKTISVVNNGNTFVPVGGGQLGLDSHKGPLFPALDKIDKKYNPEDNQENNEENNQEEVSNEELQTEEVKEAKPAKRDFSNIVDEFQSFLAKEEKLYFSKNILRTFVAGLSASRLILLEGLSGTGKSSLPRKFQQFIGGKSTFLQVQATWRDRSDIIGYYSDLTGYYKETELLKSIYESSYEPENINLIVLDEMNISRVEYYFADFLSIYEYPSDDWKIQLMQTSSEMELPKFLPEGTLTIPTNVWFVGTINVDDSTFTVTDKVYDRAIVINFNAINDPFECEYDKQFEPVSYEQLTNFFAQCQSNEKYCLDKDEKDKVNQLIHFLDETFEIKIGNRIVNQIDLFVPTFVGLGGSKYEALDMMICAKIFRKLDYLFFMGMEDLLMKLLRFLNSTFKKGSMPNCEAKINSLLKKYQ